MNFKILNNSSIATVVLGGINSICRFLRPGEEPSVWAGQLSINNSNLSFSSLIPFFTGIPDGQRYVENNEDLISSYNERLNLFCSRGIAAK